MWHPVVRSRCCLVFRSTSTVRWPRCRRGFWFKSAPAPQLFGLEGLGQPEDFVKLAEEAVERSRQSLSCIEGLNPADAVRALDDVSNDLCLIADAAELCRNVHPEDHFVDQAVKAVTLIQAYMSEVNIESSIYRTIRAAEEKGSSSLSYESQKVAKHMRESMEHEGVHLQDSQKLACLELLDREQNLSFGIIQRKEQRRTDEAIEAAAWLPVDAVHETIGSAANGLPTRKNGKQEEICIPADSPWSDAILKRAKDAKIRRLVYEKSLICDASSEAEIVELLDVRQNLAQLRGYPNWNAYAQREGLLQNPDQVNQFLHASWEALRPGLMEEMKKLALAKESLGLGDPVLEPWDIAMLISECKRNDLQGKSAQVSEFVSYNSLMGGVSLILSKLLGLQFTQETPGPVEVWHPSVQKYTVREGDKTLGVLYLDPFTRAGKMVQNAQFTLRGSKLINGDDSQVPATALCFSFPNATNGLSVSYAVTFMHEIGHALHSLLSETQLQHLSGTRGAVDFVEFPSHLFEHFVLDPDCLASYATSCHNKEKMPFHLQSAYRDSRYAFGHFEAVQQLVYALTDQAFYHHSPQLTRESDAGDVARLHKHLEGALEPLNNSGLDGPHGSVLHLMGVPRPSKFDHLIHYGGSYYCYLFNRVLSSHIWRGGFKADPFGTDNGTRLRSFFRRGSVVQSLDAIEALSPGIEQFGVGEAPLKAFVDEMRAGS